MDRGGSGGGARFRHERAERLEQIGHARHVGARIAQHVQHAAPELALPDARVAVQLQNERAIEGVELGGLECIVHGASDMLGWLTGAVAKGFGWPAL